MREYWEAIRASAILDHKKEKEGSEKQNGKEETLDGWIPVSLGYKLYYQES